MQGYLEIQAIPWCLDHFVMDVTSSFSTHDWIPAMQVEGNIRAWDSLSEGHIEGLNRYRCLP